MSAPGTSEYQARKWQIVEEELGYENIYETNEDGQPGDLVASVYGDNAHLIAASPALYDALVEAREDILRLANARWSEVEASDAEMVDYIDVVLAQARGEKA